MKKKTDDQVPSEGEAKDSSSAELREFFIPSIGRSVMAESIEDAYEQLSKEEVGDGNK